METMYRQKGKSNTKMLMIQPSKVKGYKVLHLQSLNSDCVI